MPFGSHFGCQMATQCFEIKTRKNSEHQTPFSMKIDDFWVPENAPQIYQNHSWTPSRALPDSGSQKVCILTDKGSRNYDLCDAFVHRLQASAMSTSLLCSRLHIRKSTNTDASKPPCIQTSNAERSAADAAASKLLRRAS